MNVNLHHVTGFHAPYSVQVYKDGELFYSFTKQGGFCFNLPAGIYTIQGGCERLVAPVRFEPKRIRRKPDVKGKPANITITIKPTPFKAFIIPKLGSIVIDPSIVKQGQIVYDWVLSHELGHLKHSKPRKGETIQKVEKAADAYAFNRMLLLGYNPSQISIAILTSLNCGYARSRDRIDQVFKYALKS